MKTLVFGALNIDLVFSVDHIAAPGETISSGSLTRSAGGKGANQAAALAKAGMEVYMAGKIGRDGQFLLRLLRSYGVDTGNVFEYEGNTGQAIIQLDKNKQNAILLYGGGNSAITIEEIHQTIDSFNAGDLVVLQNEIVHVKAIMERAKERGLRICLNPSPCNETVQELPLDLADMLFVNELEGASLSGLPPDIGPPQALDALAARFPRAEIILTAGKEGAWYGFREIRAKGDIIEMPVADTTGAGDTFTGYFIAAREKKMPVPEALALACKASSIAVSREGAMESIPLAGEVF